jgi:hypothetical protein
MLFNEQIVSFLLKSTRLYDFHPLIISATKFRPARDNYVIFETYTDNF